MADTVNVGAISVDIDGDDTRLQGAKKRTIAGLKEMQTVAQAQTAAMVRSFANLASSVLGVGAAIQILRSTLADSRELVKLSQATGVSIEQLQALRYAAQQSGVEFGELTQVIRQYNQRVLEMGRDVNSTGAMTFRALGIAMKDAQGNLRSIMDILPEVADKFSKAADGPNKAAIATVLFGEAGARLIPFLNQGRDGIQALKEEAKRLGIVVEEDNVKKIEELNKNLDKLSSIMRSVAADIVAWLIGPLEKTYNWFVKLTKSTGELYDKMNEESRQVDLSRLTKQLESAERSIKTLTGEEARLFSLMTNMKQAGEEGTSAWRTAQGQLDGVRTQAEAAYTRVDILKEKLRQMKEVAAAPPEEPPKPLEGTVTQGNLLFDPSKFQKELQQMREMFQNNMDEIFGEKTWLKDGWRKLLDTDGYAEAMKLMDDAAKNNLFTEQQIARMKKDLYRQEQQNIMDTAAMAAQTLTALFPKSKAAAIAAALINTSLGVTRALAQVPFPYDLIQASLIAAQGAAQIASIRSTNMSGGGSTPAVSTASATANGATAAGPTPQGTTMHITGLRDDAIYGGEGVRRMAAGLIEFQRNGGNILLSEER